MRITRRQLLIGLAVAPVVALPIKEVKSCSSFPEGTIMRFQQTNAPLGWHKLTTAAMPSHTHGCVHGFVMGVHEHDLRKACPKCGSFIIARKN